MYSYKYPRPALTTDSLIFGFDEKEKSLKILFIKRKNEPFKNYWALPGGFVDMDETVEQCATRELKEETCLELKKLSQLIVASEKNRDPRGRTVSVVFWAIIPVDYKVKAADDAAEIGWFFANKLPKLAFDHLKIVDFAINELKSKIELKYFQNKFLSNATINNNLPIIQKLLNNNE
ncbi:MAG: NUDIX hydrolase [Bacteroidota bacterium]|nr:NUDIX hydrolase [Bacteroidota bacterium]